jgi:hypothetical protein
MIPDYRTCAHVAVYAAMVFAVAALLVDWTGYTVEGYAGIVLAGTSFCAAAWYGALYDRQQRVFAGQGGAQ